MEPVSHTAKNNSQILAQIEDMISKLNGEGKEGDIKGLGHTIAELYDITVLEQFIIRLCDSGSPITAPITIKSLHHDEEPRLKALVIRKLSDDSWTLYDKIIALLMFEEYDILTEIIDSVNVDRTLHESINRALQYFIERSEYTPVFGLIYTIAQCRHRVNLLKHFYNFELNQHYIEKNKDLVHKSARCIYENKAYDSLFYFCKNFKLLKSLKTILQKEPRILEEEFVGLGTMNGIRLAYRVYGTVKKDILDNLKMISKQTYRESEFKRLVEDFTWCMNRLCKEEDVLYQYLAALDKNNPFRYMDGEARKTIPAENVVYIKAQCDEILAQLIEHKYSLGKIFKIYLNSYLSLYLSVDEVFNAFNQKTGRGSRVRYLNEIMGVELQAEVSEISEDNICFSLIQIPCQSRLFLLDSMEGEKEVLALGQKVSLSLINYDPMENAIGVELWHSSSL